MSGANSPDKTRELRGLLVFFLYKIYPSEIERTAIYKSFYQYWKTEEIDRALEYLREKDYIRCDERPNPFGGPFDRLRHYKILPGGIDICEGTADDPGILAEIGR